MKCIKCVGLVFLVSLVARHAAAEVFINEVLFDAPIGLDNGQEFFELLSASPGASVDGLRLLVLNGDHNGDGSAGVIDDVISLAGLSTGANRLLLSREGGTPSIPLIDFTPQPDPQTTVEIAGNTSFNFQNADAVTLLLVAEFTGGNGDDLDANDDGFFDVTPWSDVLDAVAIRDPTDPSYDYATQVGGQALPVLGYTPDLIFRDSASLEWIAADVIEDENSPAPIGGFYPFNPEEISSLTGESISVVGGWSPGVANPSRGAAVATPGDFNGDGMVDAADYTVWRDNLGDAETTINNSGDGLDGVDAKDYLVWRQHYGGGANASGRSAPEPRTMLLAAGALGVIAPATRRLCRAAYRQHA